MQANTQNPFWMFQISAFPFQNSVIEVSTLLCQKRHRREGFGFTKWEEDTKWYIAAHCQRSAGEFGYWNGWLGGQFLLQVWKQNLMFRCVVCLFLLNIHIIIELILNIRSLRSRENTLSFYITLIRYLHLSDNVPCFPSKFYINFVFNFSWVL